MIQYHSRLQIRKWFMDIGFFLCLLGLFILSCTSFQKRSAKNPKNIILFIGDGMGVAQMTAARTIKGVLNMEAVPVYGYITTHSANDFITESPAAATAMSTGFKTNNKMVGIAPDGDTLKTILEIAEEMELATGMVTTSFLSCATPASFASHVSYRKDYYDIAEQISRCNAEVLFGGGYKYFIPKDSLDTKQETPLSRLQSRYPVIRTAEAFRQLGTPDGAYALLAPRELPKADQREISLAEFVKKAIEILSHHKNGFFLMAEGAQIDWAGHDLDGEYAIRETIDFDQAVGVGLDFARQNGETLVLIVSDHETGGFALLDGSIADSTITKTAFVCDWHTGTAVPLFALGPGSDVFHGIHDNTFIGQTLIQYVLNNRNKKP